MGSQPGSEPQDTPRRRPTHWDHPVDERQRLRRVRRRRVRRVVLAVLVAGVVIAAAAFFYVTRAESVEQAAEDYLTQLMGSHVSVGRANFSLTEGVVLEDIVVSPREPFTEPMLKAERVDLRLNPLALLRTRIEVREIVVHRPTVTLVELERAEWGEPRWNFQAMARGPEKPPPTARPQVSLEEGQLRLVRKVEGETFYTHEMEVSGLLLPNEQDPDSLRFQTDVASEELRLSVTSGLLDARRGVLRFEGQASNVALTPQLYDRLPREVQQVWDRFEPTGSMNLKVAFDETDGFRLQAELTGVSFQYEYQNIPHTFEGLTGRATFSPTTLELEKVQGLVDGSPVRLSGTVKGFDADQLGLDLAVEAEDLVVQDHRKAVVGISPQFARLYELYSPEGVADLAFHLRREAGPDTKPTVKGTMRLRSIGFLYSKFPYQLTNVRGPVRFSSDRMLVGPLKARHSDAAVTIEGTITNPGPSYGADITIVATDIPVDDELRAALKPRQQRIFDQYAPSGKVDARVRATRDEVAGTKPRVVAEVDLRDCTVTYEKFPYRLTQTEGTMVIAPEKTELRGITGRHGPARLRLDGTVERTPEGEPARLDLSIQGEDVALDEDLAAALPPREREVYEAFHLAGRAKINGRIRGGPRIGKRPEYELDVELSDARMIYERFPFLVEDLSGRLHLTQEGVRIEGISGYNTGARVAASGWIEHRPGDYAMDLNVVGADVVLNEQLRGALGPEIRSAWSRLGPKGRVDVTADLQKAFGPDETLKHDVRVEAKGIRARLDVFPLPLEDLHGTMVFTGDAVHLQDVTARHGPTRFNLAGTVRYPDAGPQVELALKARNLRLEGALRRSVPDPLRRAMERVATTGRVDVEIDQLRYRSGPDGATEATWTGTALLDEVGLKPGIQVSDVVGTARLSGSWKPDALALDGQLWIQRGELAGKDVENLTMEIGKAPESPALNVPAIEGEFYGGGIDGRGAMALSGDGRYALTLSVMEVDFERLLKEGFRIEQDITGGKLRGTLAVRAAGAEAKDLQASGTAYITGARLYELPAVVRVLNALRLAPADRTAFTEARITYFVHDGTFVLEDVRLKGAAISLYGAGTIDPKGQLQMTFMEGEKDDKPLMPALAELVEGLRREIAVVHVTGPLTEPKVEVRSLSRLTAPLRELGRLIRESRREDEP